MQDFPAPLPSPESPPWPLHELLFQKVMGKTKEEKKKGRKERKKQLPEMYFPSKAVLLSFALVSVEWSTNQIKVQAFKAYHVQTLSGAVHQLIKGEHFLKFHRTFKFIKCLYILISSSKPIQFK